MGHRGRTQTHGVIQLDWDVLTPTGIKEMLLHEIVPVQLEDDSPEDNIRT